ncbi:nucleoside triphosphate pyrophosphohydrolase [Mycobacterium sp. SM1]|uniref:nucleoside triphosphate pyrophosphohydrolase n=1 Tax=Mycobacterium sp. SM1 TaxID=2816243 RepID=UPI001BCB0C80|nr:nucleoside triphosphate pyrophosphohydrolase [Mycobacterium sp. SM1]MBS4729183.1 nucleoside triphosphate pyrophosphohydrolase [Mycobacterium sp. SM1]
MTVVLVDPRRPSLVPVEAVEFLGGQVQYTEEMPVAVPWSLPSARPVHSGDDAPVLLSSDPDHPAVVARLAAGERLIAAPEQQRGERLVDAVAMMDKLRTAGPWESEQTHDSLRRYLLEETYELFDAVRRGDVDELREELGDVLLQVLFHARIAEEAPQRPFSIDDVADTLVRKLTKRVPGVLAGEAISLDEQLAQWEEAKAVENTRKSRNSIMDGVPTSQPALALAQKVLQRASKAGVPADLIPAALTSITVSAEVDVENALRAAVLDFMEDVRSTEKAVAAARRGEDVAEELDVAPLGVITEDEWRAYWPPPVGETVDEGADELTGEADGWPDDPAAAAGSADGSAPAVSGQSVTVAGAATPVEPVPEAPASGQGDQDGAVDAK